jgi:hypothetical protein
LKTKKPTGKKATWREDKRLSSTTSIQGRWSTSIESARLGVPSLSGQTDVQDNHYRPGKTDVTTPLNPSQNKNLLALINDPTMHGIER